MTNSDSSRKKEFHNWAKTVKKLYDISNPFRKDVNVSDVVQSPAGNRGIISKVQSKEADYTEVYVLREGLTEDEEDEAVMLVKRKWYIAFNTPVLSDERVETGLGLEEINRELQKYVLPSDNVDETINIPIKFNTPSISQLLNEL